MFVLCSSTVFSQEKNTEVENTQIKNKQNELKISVTSAIFLAALDVSYERILNGDTTFGTSIFVNIPTDNVDVAFPRDFSLTPFFRFYFESDSNAEGFFIETFGMFNAITRNYVFTDEALESNEELLIDDDPERSFNFSLGVSAGKKFVTDSGFVAEGFLGVGRKIVNTSSSENFDFNFVFRAGISLGYRF